MNKSTKVAMKHLNEGLPLRFIFNEKALKELSALLDASYNDVVNVLVTTCNSIEIGTPKKRV